MPVTLYTQDEVEVYTRELARAYEMIRDEPATDEARWDALKKIEKVLGWNGPPAVRAKPPSDQEALDAMIKSHAPYSASGGEVHSGHSDDCPRCADEQKGTRNEG